MGDKAILNLLRKPGTLKEMEFVLGMNFARRGGDPADSEGRAVRLFRLARIAGPRSARRAVKLLRELRCKLIDELV